MLQVHIICTDFWSDFGLFLGRVDSILFLQGSHKTITNASSKFWPILGRFWADFGPILGRFWVELIPFCLKQGSLKTIKNASITYDLYRFKPIWADFWPIFDRFLGEILPRAQRAEAISNIFVIPSKFSLGPPQQKYLK